MNYILIFLGLVGFSILSACSVKDPDPDPRLYEGLAVETHNGTKGFIYLVNCGPSGCAYHVTWEPAMFNRAYEAYELILMIKDIE